MIPGEYVLRDEPIVINEGRQAISLDVVNRGDRAVQVGSHFHFAEANRGLEFDRKKALGRRLDIPAGTAVRLEPGDATTVNLIEYGGDRAVYGFRDLVDGSLDPREPSPFTDEHFDDPHPRSESAAGDAPEPLPARDDDEFSPEKED